MTIMVVVKIDKFVNIISVEKARSQFTDPTICGMEAFLCPRMISLWSVGSAGVCLAPEFGVRLGQNGFKYALMEVKDMPL